MNDLPLNCVESPFPPITVGVIGQELSRFTRFWISLLSLKVPMGSHWAIKQGNNFAGPRNCIVEEMLASDAEFLWFIDDDQTFDSDIVMRLLSHDVPVVQPLVVTRKPPYLPYAYVRRESDGKLVSKDWPNLGRGLIEVDASACGGMLIRRDVLEDIEPPWFVEGKMGEGPGEDFYFSKLATEAGYQCYVDTEARSGHTGIHEVWAAWAEDIGWHIAMLLDHGLAARVPWDFGRDMLAQKVAEKQERGQGAAPPAPGTPASRLILPGDCDA